MNAEAEISAAYRWLLGREPDPAGLATYEADFASGALTSATLRHIFLNSAEFQAKLIEYRVVDMEGGAKVVIDAHEPDFGRVIAAAGVWEPHVVAVIRAQLRPGDTYVDVGANVGVMAFHAARAVGPGGRVIGFEPNPANAQAFQRGIVANGVDNVRLFALALSDGYGTVSISPNSNAKVRPTIEPTQFYPIVQAMPGDALLADQERIDFVKMDIEGYELPALRGLDRALRRHRPTVLCEFNPLCLGEAGFAPQELADHIFTLTDRVEVIDHSEERIPIVSAAALLELWAVRNRELVAGGILADGWLHFDLLFQVSKD